MKNPSEGGKTLKRWLKEERITLTHLSSELNDSGSQIQLFTSGERGWLPMPLLIKVCKWTGIPLSDLASDHQWPQAVDIVMLMERDELEEGKVA